MPNPADFPDELLFLIFEKGCEDDGSVRYVTHGRRLKPFAYLARRVCVRWMRLAGDPSNQHFWYTRAALVTHPHTILCRRLSAFQRAITQSSGSDIHIHLDFTALRAYTSISHRKDIANWPPFEVTKLKILIHAILFLAPFRNQIIRIFILSYHAQSCKYILWAFSQICPLPRLTHLALPFETDPPCLSIGDFAHLPDRLGFEPLRGIPNSCTLDRYFHLGCFLLQSLQLGHPWFKDFGSLRFSELTISIRAEDHSEKSRFLLALAQNPPMAEALRSLRISFIYLSTPLTIESNKSENSKAKVVDPGISLRNLEILFIRSSGPDSEPLAQQFSRALLPEPPPEVLDANMPCLRLLRTSVALGQSDTQPIEAFGISHRTIDSLDVTVVRSRSTDTRLKERFRSVLIRFHLKSLSLTVPSIRTARQTLSLFLGNLSLESISELDISLPLYEPSAPNLKPEVSNSPLITHGLLEASMPALQRLNLMNTNLSTFMLIFKMLDARSLSKISLSMKHGHYIPTEEEFTDANIPKRPDLRPIPSVSSIKIAYRSSQSIQEVTLFQLLGNLAPNLDELDIAVDTYAIQGQSPDANPPAVNGEIKLRELCQSLNLIDGRSVFPKLTHLHIRASMEEKPTNIEEDRKCAEEMCKRCTDTPGGSQLLLERFDFVHIRPDEYFQFDLGRGWLIDIWAGKSA